MTGDVTRLQPYRERAQDMPPLMVDVIARHVATLLTGTIEPFREYRPLAQRIFDLMAVWLRSGPPSNMADWDPPELQLDARAPSPEDALFLWVVANPKLAAMELTRLRRLLGQDRLNG